MGCALPPRSEVNKAIEIKRAEKFLGNSLEAKVLLRLPESYRFLQEGYDDFLPTFFIVSEAVITESAISDAYKSADIEGLEVRVEKAAGTKCQRCWNWRESVGTFSDAPDVCDRCYKVIAGR